MPDPRARRHREHGLHAHQLEHLGVWLMSPVRRCSSECTCRIDHLDPDLAVARRSMSISSVFQGSLSPGTLPHASSSLAFLPEAGANQFALSVSPRRSPTNADPPGTRSPGYGASLRRVPVPASSPSRRPGAQLGAVGRRRRDRHAEPGGRRGRRRGRRRGLRPGLRPGLPLEAEGSSSGSSRAGQPTAHVR